MILSTGWIIAIQPADIIVQEQGQETISELCLVGKPVILVLLRMLPKIIRPGMRKPLSTRDAALLISDNVASKPL